MFWGMLCFFLIFVGPAQVVHRDWGSAAAGFMYGTGDLQISCARAAHAFL